MLLLVWLLRDLAGLHCSRAPLLFVAVAHWTHHYTLWQAKNRQAILIKNVMLIATRALSWWVIGFLLSGGNIDHSSFVGQPDGGTTNALLKDVDKDGTNLMGWFFGFAFAATAAPTKDRPQATQEARHGDGKEEGRWLRCMVQERVPGAAGGLLGPGCGAA